MAKSKTKTMKARKTRTTGVATLAVRLAAEMPPRTTFERPRMDVLDYVKWGNLIKKWCNDPTTAPWKDTLTPSPYGEGDMQKLKDQCLAAGVGLVVPDDIKKVMIVVQADDTFILRLPPRERIQESEAALRQGGLYPIPRFYDDAYGLVLKVPADQMLDFHAERIGDYVIRLTA